MKVDKPQFDQVGVLIFCTECPFADKYGVLLDRFIGHHRCLVACPTAERYTEDCQIADSVTP